MPRQLYSAVNVFLDNFKFNFMAKFNVGDRVKHPDNNNTEIRVKKYKMIEVFEKLPKNRLPQYKKAKPKYKLSDTVICWWKNENGEMEEKEYPESELTLF